MQPKKTVKVQYITLAIWRNRLFLLTKNALLKRGPKNSGMGRPPPPIIRAMLKRKRFFLIEAFPNCKKLKVRQFSKIWIWTTFNICLFSSVIYHVLGLSHHSTEARRSFQQLKLYLNATTSIFSFSTTSRSWEKWYKSIRSCVSYHVPLWLSIS